MSGLNDIGEIIVSNVDLRLPPAPAPIFFLKGTRVDAEIEEAIRVYIGEGAVVQTAEEIPKYLIFCTQRDGTIGQSQYEGVKRCFEKYGTEACVFEYLPIEKQFVIRPEAYFVTERI